MHVQKVQCVLILGISLFGLSHASVSTKPKNVCKPSCESYRLDTDSDKTTIKCERKSHRLQHYSISRQQLKNSGKLMKNTCMPKHEVTEEQVGEIEQGKFIEDRNVMCYMSCVYGMLQVIKNNKLSSEAMLKQVDLLFSPELKEPTKIATEKCFPIAKKYKDICEAAYWTSKCMYDLDPKNFFFP